MFVEVLSRLIGILISMGSWTGLVYVGDTALFLAYTKKYSEDGEILVGIICQFVFVIGGKTHNINNLGR